MSDDLKGKTILLGITGGIAAYKAAEVCSALVKRGASVYAVMTEHATHFIGPVTFRALTGNPVYTGLWEEPEEYEIAHVSLPDRADLVLIVPATANILGKTASGIADDMLSTTLAATTAPVIFAPAMNCNMWRNPITQANVQKLSSLGYEFIGPEEGRLACGVDDIGRLAAVEAIVEAAVAVLSRVRDLEGVSILVTAGPTRESIDPVRFLTNRSSGKMGYTLAHAAVRRGAKVVLVSGPTSLPALAGVGFVGVQTANEMLTEVLKRAKGSDVVIGAAAVADYTPAETFARKVKKTGEAVSLELVPTKDIIAEVGRAKGRRLLVAFAAETENVVRNAKAKMKLKNADMVVANDVSKPGIGFDEDSNEVVILTSEGKSYKLPKQPKAAIADRILDLVKERLSAGAGRKTPKRSRA